MLSQSCEFMVKFESAIAQTAHLSGGHVCETARIECTKLNSWDVEHVRRLCLYHRNIRPRMRAPTLSQ